MNNTKLTTELPSTQVFKTHSFKRLRVWTASVLTANVVPGIEGLRPTAGVAALGIWLQVGAASSAVFFPLWQWFAEVQPAEGRTSLPIFNYSPVILFYVLLLLSVAYFVAVSVQECEKSRPNDGANVFFLLLSPNNSSVRNGLVSVQVASMSGACLLWNR